MTTKTATEQIAELQQKIAQQEATIQSLQQLEANLRESEKRFKDLFNYTPLPLWDVDFTDAMTYFKEQYQDSTLSIDEFLQQNKHILLRFTKLTKIRDINDYVFEISGTTNKEEFTKGFSEKFISTGTYENVRDMITNLWQGNRNFAMEAVQTDASGQKIFLKHICMMLHDYDYAVLMASVDISQPKLLAERLEHKVEQHTKELRLINQQLAEQMLLTQKAEEARRRSEEQLNLQREQLMRISRASSLGAMTSSLAHQLNQPLTIIGSYAQACRNKIEKLENVPEEIDYAMQKISEHTAKAGSTIHQIRSLFTNKNSTRENCNLATIIDEVIELVDYKNINRDAIKIIKNQDYALYINKLQFEHTLLNVVQNAVDSLQRSHVTQPKIIISATHSDSLFTLSVADNGQGVPTDVQRMIFDQFFTTKEDGMGMGLAICSSIVESYGGRLRLQSIPDQGATFHLDWPIDILCN